MKKDENETWFMLIIAMVVIMGVLNMPDTNQKQLQQNQKAISNVEKRTQQ